MLTFSSRGSFAVSLMVSQQNNNFLQPVNDLNVRIELCKKVNENYYGFQIKANN